MTHAGDRMVLAGDADLRRNGVGARPVPLQDQLRAPRLHDRATLRLRALWTAQSADTV